MKVCDDSKMELIEREFAIVILNYNSANLVINAIEKIRKLSSCMKIIIVDNCSTDDSKMVFDCKLKDDNVILIYNNKNSGYAAGNNVGLRYIDSYLKNINYIVVMNPDIEIDDISVFYKMMNVLKNNENIGAVTALTIYNSSFNFPNESAWKMLNKNEIFINGSLLRKIFPKNMKYTNLKINQGNYAIVDVIQGCFFAIRKETLRKIGFLDENTFLYCEEMILAKKLKKIGCSEAIIIDGFVKHNHFEKDKKLIKKENKIFDIRCLKESRKYVIDAYLEESNIYKKFAKIYLDIDFMIKKILINVGIK